MKKPVKIIVSILGIILLGIPILFISFYISMMPDGEKEDMIRDEAEQYINQTFKNHFEVYDTLYDNMGNFEFEYAAKVRDKVNNIEFLIYHDSETGQLVDTYVADKWVNELKNDIRQYIDANFKEVTDFHAFFDDEIGKELNIDPLNSGSFKEYHVAPTIRITISRTKGNQDDELFNTFISFLKNENILEHGTVIVAYIDAKGVILDEDWSKEF
ncbi:hypothetical protein [Bacillus tuaregi]|uniref:hypothetical protein n=1 Tax=Bacillus tuaregi TaxID=1816695 RepID=UPI0008F84F5D|nr:hypothetical protein [Bacillus tuaregi]